jgi:hypothetical protein
MGQKTVFAGIWTELEIMLSEVSQSTKTSIESLLTGSKWRGRVGDVV